MREEEVQRKLRLVWLLWALVVIAYHIATRCLWKPGELLLQLVAWDDAQQSLFVSCFGEA